jgi:hypothetical protein
MSIGAPRPRYAGTAVAATLTLLGAAACADPVRPDFGPGRFGPDTFPPRIEFLAPADSVYAAGQEIRVRVRITDRTPLASVAAGVLGEVTFGFPTLFPADTLFVADYPITTDPGTNGTIVFRVVATDTLSNRAAADRSFVIQ